jgi:hypothetical protein
MNNAIRGKRSAKARIDEIIELRSGVKDTRTINAEAWVEADTTGATTVGKSGKARQPDLVLRRGCDRRRGHTLRQADHPQLHAQVETGNQHDLILALNTTLVSAFRV